METMLTLICREADKTFERVGGGSKHWVRDCFAPALEDAGLTLIALSEIEALREFRVDADRYRWLRSHGYKDSIGSNDCVMFGRGIDQTMPELLDAYLDKAREA